MASKRVVDNQPTTELLVCVIIIFIYLNNFYQTFTGNWHTKMRHNQRIEYRWVVSSTSAYEKRKKKKKQIDKLQIDGRMKTEYKLWKCAHCKFYGFMEIISLLCAFDVRDSIAMLPVYIELGLVRRKLVAFVSYH